MDTKKHFDWSWLMGVPFGLLYGAVTRILFGLRVPNDDLYSSIFSTMSVAFLFFVPLVVGALAVWFSPVEKRTSWTSAFLLPIAALGLGALMAGILAVEALICIIMALPILLPMGMIGGLLACLILRHRAAKNNSAYMGALILLPFLAAPVEAQFAVQNATAVVESQIEIKADAATVWQQIIRVAPITERERSFSPVFDWIRAPKPLEATLDREGVGGVRTGKFEHGLKFIEAIQVWQPNERIEWSIQSDTHAVDEGPWGEIGGKFFDVTAASYWIEPISENKVILHLNSTHRLTTRFNSYGLLWTRWGLSEFQEEVLRVIKGRCERASN
ncbi:MAG: hypothetical protein U0175_10815 [Caldilineaceae bacterium]